MCPCKSLRCKATGQFKNKRQYVGYFLTILCVLNAGYWFASRPFEPISAASASDTSSHVEDLSDVKPCEKKGEIYDCSEDKSLERKMQIKKTMTVIRTKYSRLDSCHNPKVVNGKTLCLTAIGKDTVQGRTVACPYSLKLGTKVRFQGEERIYICEDRYSRWVDVKRGTPTIDVFAEAENMKELPAYKTTVIEVLN